MKKCWDKCPEIHYFVQGLWYNAVNYSDNSKYLLGGEKVRIQFEFAMTKLPIGYRLGMLSIIKEMVRSGSVNYYHHIFNENKHEIKPFVHSTYIKNVTLKENEIHELNRRQY